MKPCNRNWEFVNMVTGPVLPSKRFQLVGSSLQLSWSPSFLVQPFLQSHRFYIVAFLMFFSVSYGIMFFVSSWLLLGCLMYYLVATALSHFSIIFVTLSKWNDSFFDASLCKANTWCYGLIVGCFFFSLLDIPYVIIFDIFDAWLIEDYFCGILYSTHCHLRFVGL